MPASVAADYEDLLALPFLEDGRFGDPGINCLGVVLEVYRRAGLYLPDAQVVGKAAACRHLSRIALPAAPLDIAYVARGGEERCLVLVDGERALSASPARGVYVESVARIRRVSRRVAMEFWRWI